MSRRSIDGAWLVIALVIVGLMATRTLRAFGPLSILAAIVAVAVVFATLRAFGSIWIVPHRRSVPQPPDPRNVTPAEPTTSATQTIAGRPSKSPVVVVEPGWESLETKLAVLDRLHDDGRLTDPEFEAKRAQLIDDY